MKRQKRKSLRQSAPPKTIVASGKAIRFRRQAPDIFILQFFCCAWCMGQKDCRQKGRNLLYFVLRLRFFRLFTSRTNILSLRAFRDLKKRFRPLGAYYLLEKQTKKGPQWQLMRIKQKCGAVGQIPIVPTKRRVTLSARKCERCGAEDSPALSF